VINLIRNNKGFTFTEAVLVTLIASLLMLVFQSFFVNFIRNSMKGDDAVDSFRAASRLFSQIQRDLEEFNDLTTHGAVSIVGSGEFNIPPTATFSSRLTLNVGARAIEYSVIEETNGKTVQRLVTNNGTQESRRLFGMARIQNFEVAYFIKREIIGGVEKSFGQLLTNVVVKSENKNFPTSEVKLTSNFFPERMGATEWNYLQTNP
jgi:competence protein ComGC